MHEIDRAASRGPLLHAKPDYLRHFLVRHQGLSDPAHAPLMSRGGNGSLVGWGPRELSQVGVKGLWSGIGGRTELVGWRGRSLGLLFTFSVGLLFVIMASVLIMFSIFEREVFRYFFSTPFESFRSTGNFELQVV